MIFVMIYSHNFEHIFNTYHEQITIDIIISQQIEAFQIFYNF
jgi:HD superfamily phosphohydrolase